MRLTLGRSALLELPLAAITITAFLFGTSALAQPDSCSDQAGAVTNIGRVVPGGQGVAPGRIEPVNYNEPGRSIRYLRVLLEANAPPGSSWYLTIRDADLRVLQTLSHEQVVDQMPRWTKRLDAGRTIYFDLESAFEKVRINLKRVIVMPEEAERPYYSRQDRNRSDFSPLWNAPSERRPLGDFVGFVMSHWATESWCCSAVVVGKDRVLTNWHCGGDEKKMPPSGFWSPQICENTIIDFSWDGDNVDREFVCKRVLDKSEAHDFALLEVAPLTGDDKFRVPRLRQNPVTGGEEIQIIHHPACRPKQISTACRVVATGVLGWRSAASSDFTYPCDTEGGSSGAPVFDKDGLLVGIHHLGFEEEQGVCDKLNKGVRLESIIGAMKPSEADETRKQLTR